MLENDITYQQIKKKKLNHKLNRKLQEFGHVVQKKSFTVIETDFKKAEWY